MEIIKEVLTTLGTATILVGAVAFLAKSLMTHVLSKNIEQHKARLDATHALELEKLRAQLTKETLEHEIKYRRVDERVADHLAETYRRLFRLYQSVSSCVAMLERIDEPTKQEKLDAATVANRDFWEYFLQNRVYIPPTLYRRTKTVADKLADITNGFTRGRHREEHGRTSQDEDYWSEAFRQLNDEAEPLFTAFVIEVQRRLGVEDIKGDAGPNDGSLQAEK